MAAAACLSRLDEALTGYADTDPDALRRRGSFLVIFEVLTQHADYFDAGAPGMRFTEINLFGVYIAPISLMMVAASVFTIGLRRFAARFRVPLYVWHPSPFVLAVYMIVLFSIVLLVAAR